MDDLMEVVQQNSSSSNMYHHHQQQQDKQPTDSKASNTGPLLLPTLEEVQEHMLQLPGKWEGAGTACSWLQCHPTSSERRPSMRQEGGGSWQARPWWLRLPALSSASPLGSHT